VGLWCSLKNTGGEILVFFFGRTSSRTSLATNDLGLSRKGHRKIILDCLAEREVEKKKRGRDGRLKEGGYANKYVQAGLLD